MVQILTLDGYLVFCFQNLAFFHRHLNPAFPLVFQSLYVIIRSRSLEFLVLLISYCGEKSFEFGKLRKILLRLHETNDPKLLVIPEIADIHYNSFHKGF